MKAKCLLILSFLCIGGLVHAEQGCPPGFTLNASGAPGGPMCIPISGYGTTNNTTPPPASGPRWQLTWGAIAASSSGTSDIGVSVGHFSKRKAKHEAIERCEMSSRKKCELVLAYKNQCAVIAWPSLNGETIGGTPMSQGGPSIEVASNLALSSCSAKNAGRECKIVYSDCTPPVLVQN
ncbi:MAG: DUF4189 domain-containing protein [Rhodoferax sp.]|nr:DUF4189 domain-containing protein [Rhodoferax sp.]